MDWKSRRRKTARIKRKKSGLKTTQPPKDPDDDIAAALVRFAHEPLLESIKKLRREVAGGIVDDLCDLSARYDAAWSALGPWLRTTDTAAFETDFKSTSAYRLVHDSTRRDIVSLKQILADPSSTIIQRHRATDKLEKGRDTWATECEHSLSAFGTLVARWLRKKELDESILSQELLFNILRCAADDSTKITAENGSACLASHSASVVIRRCISLIKLLSPAFACAAERISPDKAGSIPTFLQDFALWCAERRKVFVDQLSPTQEQAVTLKHPSTLSKWTSLGYYETIVYSQSVKIPASTIAVLGQPFLLSQSFRETARVSKALEMLRVAGSNTARTSRVVTRMASEAHLDATTVKILESFRDAFDDMEGDAPLEQQPQLQLPTETTCENPFDNYKNRSQHILSVLQSLLSVSGDEVSSLMSMVTDAIGGDCRSSTDVSVRMSYLRKEASAFDVGSIIENIAPSHGSNPIDIVNAVTVLGRAAASDEHACKRLADSFGSVARARAEIGLLDHNVDEHVNSVVSSYIQGLSPATPKEERLIETAFRPFVIKRFLPHSTENVLQESLAELSFEATYRPSHEIDAKEDSQRWDDVIDTVSKLVFLETWLWTDEKTSQNAAKLLEVLAPKLLPYSHHLQNQKSVLWLPARMRSLATEVSVHSLSQEELGEVLSALLECKCGLYHDAFCVDNDSDFHSIQTKAERVVRSWFCRCLLSKSVYRIQDADETVRVALQKVFDVSSAQGEAGKSYGKLAQAGERAHLLAEQLFQDEVAELRLRRYFESRREEVFETVNENILKRVDELLGEMSEAEAEECISTLRATMTSISEIEALKLLHEAAHIVNDERGRLLESAARWTCVHDMVGKAIQSARHFCAAGDTESALKSIQTAANNIKTGDGCVSFADVAERIDGDDGFADKKFSAASVSLIGTVAFLDEAATTIAETTNERDSHDLLAKMATWAVGHDILGPALENSSEILGNGDNLGAQEVLRKAARSVVAHSTLRCTLEGVLKMMGTTQRHSEESGRLETNEFKRVENSKVDDDIGEGKSEVISRKESKEEYQIMDKLLAACVAEQTMEAIALTTTIPTHNPKFLRLDALVVHAQDVGLPMPTFVELVALGTRFRVSHESMTVDSVSTASARGPLQLCIEPLDSSHLVHIDAIADGIAHAVTAIRVAAFDASRLSTPRIQRETDKDRPWYPPSLVVRDSLEGNCPALPSKRSLASLRLSKLSQSLAEIVVSRYDRDGDSALSATELKSALASVPTRWSYGGGIAFYEALVKFLTTAAKDRLRKGHQIDARQLSAYRNYGGSQCAFVEAALCAGFEKISRERPVSSKNLRAGYGLLNALERADQERRGFVTLSVFEEILASEPGGHLQISPALGRILIERFGSKRRRISYMPVLEWLVPRGALLELHVIGAVDEESSRFQIHVDAWTPVSDIRALISRRLFWSLCRDGQTTAARLEDGAALYPEFLASEFEKATTEKKNAALKASKSTSSEHEKASALDAVRSYEKLALLTQQTWSTPVFSTFACKETLFFVCSSSKRTLKYPKPVSTQSKLAPTPAKRVLVEVPSKMSRRPMKEANRWSSRELAAYFRELEIPAFVSEAVVDMGIPGSSAVYESTCTLVQKLRTRGNDFVLSRLERAIGALRTAVLGAAWDQRNGQCTSKWPPSVVAALLWRSRLDPGDGSVIEKFRDIDGYELFGSGERGVIHDETLRKIGVDNLKLRQQIRQVAIKERLKVQGEEEPVKKRKPSIDRVFTKPTRVVAAPPTEVLESDLAPLVVDNPPLSPPQALATKIPSSPPNFLSTADSPLDMTDFIDREKPPRLEQVDLSIFSVDSIHIPGLESMEKIQDDEDLLISRGFLDTSWINSYADSPIQELGTSRFPMLTPSAVFAAFTAQLEQEADQQETLTSGTEPFW